MAYDAFLLVSFGGPEGTDDVMPFLRNVTRGRGIPEDRLLAVAEHYYHFGGVSPINGQCRDLIAALGKEIDLPIYWGNRNWAPYLSEVVATMRDDGVEHAIAFVTSPYGSYSSCRQYLDDIDRARATAGAGAPVIDKIRHYHDHPGYIEAHADGVRAALAQLPPGEPRLVFTAHSIPTSAAATAGPDGGTHRYEAQLREAAALVADAVAPGLAWDFAWQSRSGPAQVPWLAPDINDHLRALAADGVTSAVVSPIGFISDHVEVAWDLDNEAAATARELGIGFARAATPGTHPAFVRMVAELVRERTAGAPVRKLGTVPCWNSCPVGCCTAPVRPGHATLTD
jgi:protoporphyrin/coproporphyrin ferrochelatase